MVSTRSKARRPSTPLSSPPASPSPRPSGSPEIGYAAGLPPKHADESASSVQAESAHEFTDSDDGFNSDHDSDSDHEDYCGRHTSELATHCNGRTYGGKKCRYRARIFPEGCLPLCGQHEWQRIQAGRCQAVESCGHLCNRLAPNTPPYFFCVKRENGTSTLPCHIMLLPTELRLMIFRYLFPKTIEANAFFEKQQFAVLRVSRQFYDEASAIVYSELKFEAIVDPTSICLFGRCWTRATSGELPTDLDTALCRPGVQRIRHLEVSVHFGEKHKRVNGIGGSGVIHEEYAMYQVRDAVRKLVHLLSTEQPDSTSGALKQLVVKPRPDCKQLWQSDEIIAAIFFILEPFLTLDPIEDCRLLNPPRPPSWSWRHSDSASVVERVHKDDVFRRLRKQWLKSLKGSEVKGFSKVRKASTDVATAYSKIEDFAHLIYTQDAAHFKGKASSKHGWTASTFRGIERVLHIARVAFDDFELEKLDEIYQAIVKRWIKSHALQQRSFAAIAANVASLLDGNVSIVDGYDPDAFNFDVAPDLEEDVASNEMWPEVIAKDTILNLKDPGVTVKEEGTRVTLCKDGHEKVWLKTPTVARQLRAYRRNKQ
ncbi:hypothetical protein E8E12_010711 [Didymella heteroderae]|uniref:F-box domain-containing protein n=1 Tax=Didymella heteroderae TaxID=1769908 RepID=A0A9P4WYH9_9PLEO|nr:hypothetical protein E8E12_010711 [Didymella heteroderae]